MLLVSFGTAVEIFFANEPMMLFNAEISFVFITGKASAMDENNSIAALSNSGAAAVIPSIIAETMFITASVILGILLTSVFAKVPIIRAARGSNCGMVCTAPLMIFRTISMPVCRRSGRCVSIPFTSSTMR